MNNGEMNNKKLYKDTFSKLRASDTAKTEVRDMEKIKPRVRFTKIAVACMAMLILTGASSGLTYAATGGETANPIDVIKIYLNGDEIGTAGYTKNDDGSYTIKLDKDDNVTNIDFLDEENGSQTTVDSNGKPIDGAITYKPDDNGESSEVELKIDSETADDSDPGNIEVESAATPSAEK